VGGAHDEASEADRGIHPPVHQAGINVAGVTEAIEAVTTHRLSLRETGWRNHDFFFDIDGAQDFSIITTISLMLFSVLHYPWATTIHTIWKETKSAKWTLLSNLIPLAVALLVCLVFTQSAHILGFF
jgi:Fe2+ transport system protein B